MSTLRIWFDMTRQGRSVYVNDEMPAPDDRYPGGRLFFLDVEVPGFIGGTDAPAQVVAQAVE